MKEYFSHDHNARHDRKIVALVNKYKATGYGVFWATNEMMHEEGGELEYDELTFCAIAKQLNEEEILVETVIKDCVNIFKLYILSGEKITSNRVKRNLTGSKERKLAKIEAGRRGGIKSGESRKSKQNEALLQANEAVLEATNQRKGKERKGKESRLSTILSPVNEDSLCYDAEEYLLKDHIKFDKICIATLKGAEEVKKELHNYHLWLAKKEKYPTGKAAVVAGIESWILNARNFKNQYGNAEVTNGSSSLPHYMKKLNS